MINKSGLDGVGIDNSDEWIQANIRWHHQSWLTAMIWRTGEERGEMRRISRAVPTVPNNVQHSRRRGERDGRFVSIHNRVVWRLISIRARVVRRSVGRETEFSSRPDRADHRVYIEIIDNHRFDLWENDSICVLLGATKFCALLFGVFTRSASVASNAGVNWTCRSFSFSRPM